MCRRTLSSFAVLAVGTAAHAQFAFSNLQATYSVEGGSSNPVDWVVTQSSSQAWIRFDDSVPPYQTTPNLVTNTNPSTISYDVVSDTPVSTMSFVFTSDVTWYSLITLQHEVFANGNRIAFLNTARIGSGLTDGGPNGERTDTMRVDFSEAVTHFSVVDSFNLENFAGGNYAHLINVEHDYAPVPEPLSCLGLGLGASLLLRRRRSR